MHNSFMKQSYVQRGFLRTLLWSEKLYGRFMPMLTLTWQDFNKSSESSEIILHENALEGFLNTQFVVHARAGYLDFEMGFLC